MPRPFGRVITAMVTPFTESGEVDYEQAKRLAVALLDSGTDSLVLAGSTGESPVLSHEEKLRLFETVVGAVAGRGAVIAGSGTYNTRESVELTREAERIGVDGALLVVPYYNRPPQDGLYAHFRAIAEGTSLPCLLYNIPSRTGTNMTATTTLRLAQVDNIAGIKESSGNFDQVGEIIAKAPEDFRVYSGDDSATLPIVALGGYGVVSVAAHLVGRQIRRVIDAFVVGDAEGAAALHHRLMPFVNALFLTTNPIPVKYLLNRAGFPVGPTRLPLTGPDPTTAATLDRILAEIEIDLPIPSASGRGLG
jgi:4-hydroxy-tetrahydrodipicolinate synthase